MVFRVPEKISIKNADKEKYSITSTEAKGLEEGTFDQLARVRREVLSRASSFYRPFASLEVICGPYYVSKPLYLLEIIGEPDSTF